MTIKETVAAINDIVANLYNNNVNIYKKLVGVIPLINRYYKELIALVPELNRIGMEIDMTMLTTQLSRLSEAIENKDKVMIFDSLKYEVADTLMLYDEINDIMENG